MTKIIFCIVFFGVMPFKVMIAQDVGSDTAQQSELDIKYDSILAKAVLSFTDSSYKEAIDYYKQASALKPNETYPYKMMSYVQNTMIEVAAKQKRSDELRRKAKIKDNLNKANQAIVDSKWDSAKILFNEILTLQPEKADEEYAKAKVAAIDLELQRIVARTPPKPEPKPVFVPKNRREARAHRKLEERNAMLAAAAKKIPQQHVQAAPPINNAVANSRKEQKPIPATGSPKNVTVAAPASTQILQKPIVKSLPPANRAMAADSTKNIPPKPVEAISPAKNTAIAGDSAQKVPQKSAAAGVSVKNQNNSSIPPTTRVTQKPTETSESVSSPAAPVKEISQKPTQRQLPTKDIPVATPSAKEIQQKPVQPQSIEATSAAKNTATAAPASNAKLPPLVAPPVLNLSDSSDSVKLICQDISFIGTNAYIKVLIQNNSTTTDFLTDTLHVSIKKNNGILKTLDQRFISNFPVVNPQKELVLVYFADASIGVEADDIFMLEMKDKIKKTKFSIQVPWRLYIQSKNF